MSTDAPSPPLFLPIGREDIRDREEKEQGVNRNAEGIWDIICLGEMRSETNVALHATTGVSFHCFRTPTVVTLLYVSCKFVTNVTRY